MKFLNILFFAIPEREYEFIRYRNQLESTAFTVLEEHGAVVKFLKLKEPGYIAENTNPGEVFFNGKNNFFHFPLSMYLYIKREKPDVVFIHSFIFPIQVFFLKFFISRKTKVVIQHHAEKPFTHRLKRYFQKLAYSNADAYLFSSPDLASSFLKHRIIKNKAAIHEVMEGSGLFYPSDNLSARKKLGIGAATVFLWVGRLNDNKDPFTVLKAFEKFKERTPDFKLYMIYGTSELEAQVKEFLKVSKLSSHVELIGKIPHSDLGDWFNAADYFIAASHYEGSGIALCEAMACGCVPIVSEIPSFVSMTDSGGCGYLFKVGNDVQLLQILLQLDNSRRKELRAKVIEKFNRDLSFKAIGLKISKILEGFFDK